MTDYKAKDLGQRALVLGMPWEDGLMDGCWGARIGCYDDPAISGATAHTAIRGDSWPDFRDPVTEAWLHCWAQAITAKTCRYPASHCVIRENKYTIKHEIVLDTGWPDGWMPVAHAETRAEAWILALEKLKGEG